MSLYDTDFVQWARHNAALLRSGNVAEADLENIAEEIDSMGKADARQLRSRIERILEHLLKLHLANAALLERNEARWRLTVMQQQGDLADLLEDSPSLKPCVAEAIQKKYPLAAKRVRLECRDYSFDPPAECPFSVEEVLGGEELSR